MIVGIILRYYKTYKGRKYIPLTDEDRFSGLVGNNGIGKSSILESLDAFFNDKPWNLHTATRKSGTSTILPEIIPVFLLEKSSIATEFQPVAKLLSTVALDLVVDQSQQATVDYFKHLTSLHANQNLDLKKYYILPIGIDYRGVVSLGIFNNKKLVELFYSEEFLSTISEEYTLSNANKTKLDKELDEFKGFLSYIKSKFDYIYIPREISPEQFTKLETKEIQVLMGESLNDILESKVTTSQIDNINTSLKGFIAQIAGELGDYSYRTPTARQQNLKKAEVYNLIIEAFFSTRKLHKKQGEHWLDISSLSSGEKQKAIINIAHSLLTNHRASGSNLIIGVDEPESSLHISACYDQFDMLYRISRECMQVIFSTHWYGFLPTVESGSATFITKKEDEHVFDQVNLANYREQVKRLSQVPRVDLPFDVRLKSLNDLVQSIISSTTSSEPYNWLICEGSSERIYLSKYLQDLVVNCKLRIVPVGGAKEIKRLYRHLSTSYEDFKDEIKGKIYLLSDTDSQFVNYDVHNEENLKCQRMVSILNDNSTKLVNIPFNPVGPETEIEDVLNGKAFYNALLTFTSDYSTHLKFLDNYTINDVSECCSRSAINFRSSEVSDIKNFFDEDNVKYNFSKKYCEILDDGNIYEIPDWIVEVRQYFES